MTDTPKHPRRDESPNLGEDGLVVEGLVTTLDADGKPHLSPMGPIVDLSFERLLLRPFADSHTCKNLVRIRQGAFHITDDVELIAAAAIGELAVAPAHTMADGVATPILANACRWYAFDVESVDESAERVTMACRVVDRGVIREFLGFNRAKHAVVEAAILATRVHLLDRDKLLGDIDRLAPLVAKTGSAAEHRAFRLLEAYIKRQAAAAEEPTS